MEHGGICFKIDAQQIAPNETLEITDQEIAWGLLG